MHHDDPSRLALVSDDDPAPPQASRLSRRFRLRTPLTILGALVVLLAAGSAVALAVPVVSVTPDRSIAQMLPAGTAVYISADLNPSGATRDNLGRMMHAFTDQPGWSKIGKTFDSSAHGQGQQQQCVNQTQGQVQDHLSDLGHMSVWAVLGGKNLNLLKPAGLSHFSNSMVFLASLDVHRTLVQALGGFHLALQQTSTSYRGTTIYLETFNSCGKMGSGVPSKIYAALIHGYVALGLGPQPIERIVDTAAGTVKSLAGDPQYTSLMARLPADQLGGYYLSGQALKQLGVQSALRTLPNGGRMTSSEYRNLLHPTAGALGVQPDGFHFVAASYAPSGPQSTAAAGQIASQLPRDTLALVSVQSLKTTIDNGMKQLRKDGILTGTSGANADKVIRDLTPNLSGEVDVALLHPAGKMTFRGPTATNLPLSLLWQVDNPDRALSGLHDLVRQAKASNQLTVATAADGTKYYVSKQGYGYAVHKGWAIASYDVRGTIDALSASPTLSSNPAFTRASTPGTTATSLWYVDLHGLRVELEDSFLGTVSRSEQQQYNEYARPVLTPLQSISGSAGTSSDGKLGLLSLFLGISK